MAVVANRNNAPTIVTTYFTGKSYHVPQAGRHPRDEAGVVHSFAMGRVAYFVSPHGFGHAARACAVMAEMRRRQPAIYFDVFTEVPEWFFSESLGRGFTYHHLRSDVGLVQSSPLVEDLDATVALLDETAGDGTTVDRLAERLHECGCSIVVADISPLGLEVAVSASIPSVLVENFTWDWVYANYPNSPCDLRKHGRRLAQVFAGAELRIQTEPVCQPQVTAVQVPPVARSPRLERSDLRRRLGVPAGEPMIVVSMGGVPWDCRDFTDFDHTEGPWIVIPGGSESGAERHGRMILLPFHADVFHPDLVAASDLVVSKLGYSTVAETYRAGAALAYVTRQRFPESPILAGWVEEHMVAAEIGEELLRNGAWLEAVGSLLNASRGKAGGPNGAGKAAKVILERLGSSLF